MDNSVFNHLLDSDEKIIKTFKQSKLKGLIVPCILGGSLLLLSLTCLIISIICDIQDNISNPAMFLALHIFIGFITLIFALVLLFVILHYKKVTYGYSNKKIYILTGIFKKKYLVIPYNYLSDVIISYSLIDLMNKKRSGTIDFSNPDLLKCLTENKSKYLSLKDFRLSNIDHPEEVYEELRTYIASLIN